MNNKNLLLLGVVAVAAVGGYVLYKKHKASQPSPAAVVTNPNQRNPGTGVNVLGDKLGEYLSAGQQVLDIFRKQTSGF
jgi:LPXTG-motif cell wall-anchored protein